MELNEARAILDGCTRTSVRDRDSGATEVGWTNSDGDIVALGWFARKSSIEFEGGTASFTDADADALRYCGTVVPTVFLQPSPEEQELASLARLVAETVPYSLAAGGGLMIV